MLKVIEMVSPDSEQIEAVIHGMRHAFKSYDRSDSCWCVHGRKNWYGIDLFEAGACKTCANKDNCDPYDSCGFVLGEKDLELAKNLISAGNASHRKFLRQLPLIMEIRAPFYWWKQFDTYGVGVTKNSQSTMHCMVKDKFTKEDFSFDNAAPISYEEWAWGDILIDVHIDNTVKLLNQLRKKYYETKDMKYWYAINELLPQSYMQTRTVSLNYEVALQIIEQRKGHKLDEWAELIENLLNATYMREFAEAAGLL